MFEIRNLSSSLQDGRLNQFSLTIDKSEIHGLLCSSSSWMYELLDILSGKVSIGKGEIKFNGNSIVTKYGLSGISLVTRDMNLYKDISILENLYIAEKKGIFYSKTRCIERYRKIFEEIGIPIDLNKKVEQLSRRDSMIVELLRCSVLNTKVMILHETASYFSYKTYSEMLRILNHYKKAGTVILYLTSKWEDALKICDSITVVSNGKNVATFSKEQINNNPRELYYSMLGYDGQIERTLNKDEQEQITFFEMLKENMDIIEEGHDRNIYLLKYLKKINDYFHADSSMIYLVDAASDGIYRVIAMDRAKEEAYILAPDAVRNYIHEDFFYLTHNNSLFNTYFKDGENDLKTVMGCSIHIYNKIKILLQVSYTRYYVYTSKDKSYLSAVCREIAVLVENSRLAGESVLLQESHHRIKNNLQLVISLLEMQKYTASDRMENTESANTLTEIINETIYRMKSIASIHNILAHKSSINSQVSITSMMNQLSDLYRSKAEIHIVADDFEISNKRATSLILVLNELISNGVKHSGIKEKPVKIKLFIKIVNGLVNVIYKDNGKGFSEDLNFIKDGGIGTLIVSSIIKNEFKGTIEQHNDNGACVAIQFPEKNLNDMIIEELRY